MNLGEHAATFHVYANDGLVTAEGDFDLPPAQTQPDDSGSWISFTLPESAVPSSDGGFIVTLDPKQTLPIAFVTTVPANATPGDHPAGIVAEFVPDSGSDMKVASRVGVRVHLRVAGDIDPIMAVAVLDSAWTPSLSPFAPGTMSVRVESTNEGNVRLGTTLAVSIAGPFGLAKANATVTHREVLPSGKTVDVVDVQLWGLVFVNGGVSVAVSAVGEDVIGGPLLASRATFTAWAVPYSQLGVVMLLALLVWLVVRARGRSKVRMQARIVAALAAATAQDA